MWLFTSIDTHMHYVYFFKSRDYLFKYANFHNEKGKQVFFSISVEKGTVWLLPVRHWILALKYSK